MRPSTVLSSYDLRHLYKEVSGHYPDSKYDEGDFSCFECDVITLAESFGYEYVTAVSTLDVTHYVFLGGQPSINGLRDELEVKLKSIKL